MEGWTMAREQTKYEEQECEDGQCPDCGTKAEYRTCAICGRSKWIIDCGHMSQPRPIAGNGIAGTACSCEDCEEAAREKGAART